MKNKWFLSLTVFVMLISTIGALPVTAASTDISITSPASGGSYNDSSSISFSWTSPRTTSDWRMFWKIDSSGSWTSGSLSGSFSQILSSGSHTFSVKIDHYEQRCIELDFELFCYYTWIQKDTETRSFSVTGSASPNDITVYYGGNALKSFKSGSNSDFRLIVGSVGEILHSDYVKVYIQDASGGTQTEKTIYLPSSYDAGDVYSFTVYESELYHTSSKGSAEYSHRIHVRNYFGGSSTSDNSPNFNVMWQKAKLTLTFVSFKLAGTEPGQEEYRFEFKNDATKVNKGSGDYDDGKEVTVNWIVTFYNFKRDYDLSIKIKDDDNCWGCNDDRIFEGNLDLNYEHSSAFGPSSTTQLNDNKKVSYNGEDIYYWTKNYIRGVDSWYYIKVKVKLENLRGV